MMSSRASEPNGDDDRWRPDSSLSRHETKDAVSGVTGGLKKMLEGGEQTITSVLLLALLLLDSILTDESDEEDYSEAQERTAEWDARANPIQDRFDAENVEEDDVEDAIEWARSQ